MTKLFKVYFKILRLAWLSTTAIFVLAQCTHHFTSQNNCTQGAKPMQLGECVINALAANKIELAEKTTNE